MSSKHTDHIDPKWKEGRDYQLVCGLNVSENFVERDPAFNIRKSNCFLPYRVIKDELGCAPIHEGDLALFLDPDTGEWVFESFLGEWWWSKAMSSSGRSQPRDEEFREKQRVGSTGRVTPPEVKNKISLSCVGRRLSLETKRKMSLSHIGIKKPDGHGDKVGEANRRRPKVECPHCGEVLNECYFPRHVRTRHSH